MRTSKYVHSADDLPSGEHWAIIEGSSVTVPGDERSRTNPGHGYPEHTEHYCTYLAFTDEEEFKAELQRRFESNSKYSYGSRSTKGIHVMGTYQPKTSVQVVESK